MCLFTIAPLLQDQRKAMFYVSLSHHNFMIQKKWPIVERKGERERKKQIRNKKKKKEKNTVLSLLKSIKVTHGE